MTEVEMLNISNKGKLLPIRFRIQVGDEFEVVKVNSAIFVEENRLSGNRMQIFKCKVANSGQLRDMKIYYEVDTCKWLINI